MSAKEAAKQFFESISGLTGLEVMTYTGKLEQAIDRGTGRIQWDSFKPTQGELALVAAMLVRPNLHTVNYRAEALEHGDLEALTKLHWAAASFAPPVVLLSIGRRASRILELGRRLADLPPA